MPKKIEKYLLDELDDGEVLENLLAEFDEKVRDDTEYDEDQSAKAQERLARRLDEFEGEDNG